ncbi:MAG: FAD-dependent oxidoreductase, partial [Isosphaeraceae bacterium]
MPPLPAPGQCFDVAIAGAGPAGASLAGRLARQGMHVALLDAGAFPRDKLCGEFLSPEAWGILDRMGLSDDLAGSGYQAIDHLRLTTPGGRVIDAEIKGPDGRPGIGLSRSVLDALLASWAVSAGAVFLERCRVSGPVNAGGRVIGLHARHPELGRFEVRAAVVVAADGRHSPLVQQTGTTRPRSRFRSRHFGLKRHLSISDPDAVEPSGTVGLHLVPGGYGGTCLIEGQVTNLCALLPESALREYRGNLDRLADAWLDRNPALARLRASGSPAAPWKAVSGVRVEVSTPRTPGIFYVGDCQGTVDPLGGQGMTMALLGAELLVPFVERGLKAGADELLQRAALDAWH